MEKRRPLIGSRICGGLLVRHSIWPSTFYISRPVRQDDRHGSSAGRTRMFRVRRLLTAAPRARSRWSEMGGPRACPSILPVAFLASTRERAQRSRSWWIANARSSPLVVEACYLHPCGLPTNLVPLGNHDRETRKANKSSTWSQSSSLVERLRVMAVVSDGQFPTEVATRPKARRKSKAGATRGRRRTQPSSQVYAALRARWPGIGTISLSSTA